MASTNYRVSLEKFEGPLDLLLYLIRREEVEIYDIPLSNICDQYLQYIEMMKGLNIDLAGEFMVMASTLMEIKSKMLLPGEDLDEEEENEDPRLSLVKQLMEYRKFKERTARLKYAFDDQSLRHPRPGYVPEQPQDNTVNLGEIGLFDLFSAYKGIIEEVGNIMPSTIVGDEVTQEEHMYTIVDKVTKNKSAKFSELFPVGASRAYLAGVFIGILELTRMRKVLCFQNSRYGDIRLTTPEFHRDNIANLEAFHRLQDRKITVLGLGRFKGGTSLVRYLAEHGALVTVSDSANEEDLTESIGSLDDVENITYHLGGHDDADITTANSVFVSEAIKPDAPMLKSAFDNNIELDTAMNFFLRHTPATIVGVTGTTGKTTTTTLLGLMLQKAQPDVLVAGNMGTPYLNRLDYLTEESVAVLELSSFQLARTAWIGIAPKVAVVTNMEPNHLDWHGTNTEYKQSKYNILRYQGDKDYAVLNYDDETLREWGERCPGNVIWASATEEIEGYFIRDDMIIERKDGKESMVVSISGYTLPGNHNRLNLVLAVAAARACAPTISITDKHMRAIIETAEPIRDRLVTVSEFNGVRFVNDSKSTTPDALKAGASSFDENVILIAGGHDKGSDFKAAAAAAGKYCKAAMLYGDTARRIGRYLRKGMDERDKKTGKHMYYVENLDTAFKQAVSMAQPGDTILLSPGSASYGDFVNYEARAQAFVDMVRDYETNAASEIPDNFSAPLSVASDASHADSEGASNHSTTSETESASDPNHHEGSSDHES